MTEADWETYPPGLADDAALGTAVLEAHEAILRVELAGEPMLNTSLGIELRALRRIEGWRVLLLLTPWMLARLLFPDEPPAITLPDGWSAGERKGGGYLVLGPRITFQLLSQPQQAHLSYDARLGHYLLQPICLDMEPYPDAEAVFEEWGRVIRVRDENMERAKRDCPLQTEISRREIFRRLRQSDD